jgi:hypothetical protein
VNQHFSAEELHVLGEENGADPSEVSFEPAHGSEPDPQPVGDPEVALPLRSGPVQSRDRVFDVDTIDP